ncbi:hypothetical protein BC827DRAFT_1253129, partial [Russula dissimulans]
MTAAMWATAQMYRHPSTTLAYEKPYGKLESAVEILERGRTLLWSQMRGLRTPLTSFAQWSRMLAEQFNIATSTQASGMTRAHAR